MARWWAGREDLFEEDLEPQAVEEELAPLSLQLALVHSRRGRHAAAAEAYQARALALCYAPVGNRCVVTCGLDGRCGLAWRGAQRTAVRKRHHLVDDI